MIKITENDIRNMERQHPGITEQIWRFENADLPPCPSCGSTDTASVQVGVIGRTIYLATATTKFFLIPNGPKKGSYYCRSCRQFFGPRDPKPRKTRKKA